MHAYLLVSENDKNISEKLLELSGKLKATSIEFPLSKIEDVRILRKDLKISQSKKVIILIKNIDSATKEAQNALLKSLEEPPKNVYFMLTAKNREGVLQTILSRCQLIPGTGQKPDANSKNKDLIIEFINAGTNRRLEIVEHIRKREEAVGFAEDLIRTLHKNLTGEGKAFKNFEVYLVNSQEALNALKQNGNVTIQLTNLVVKLDQIHLSDSMDEV